MDKELDIDNWERKDHYNFYKNFDEPFFGVTVNIDCTKAYKFCKEQGHSFFLYYLHKTLKSANTTEAFKLRIVGDKVILFETINAAPTVLRPNDTFGFSYMDYFENYSEFETAGKQEIESIQKSDGLHPKAPGENVIHFSALPWIKFTSFSHARNFSPSDSCPKIAFGKMTEENGKREMPVSIHVHHALVDGIHLGAFIDLFQELMNGKEG